LEIWDWNRQSDKRLAKHWPGETFLQKSWTTGNPNDCLAVHVTICKKIYKPFLGESLKKKYWILWEFSHSSDPPLLWEFGPDFTVFFRKCLDRLNRAMYVT